MFIGRHQSSLLLLLSKKEAKNIVKSMYMYLFDVLLKNNLNSNVDDIKNNYFMNFSSYFGVTVQLY